MKKREGQRERRRAVKSVAQRKGNSETFRDFYYMNFSGETLAIHSPPKKKPSRKNDGREKGDKCRTTNHTRQTAREKSIKLLAAFIVRAFRGKGILSD